MITYTSLYSRAADIVGISLTQNSQDLANIKQDLNQGVRLFKNAARRYWTRLEKSTDIVANQQYYQMPPDCVRVTQVRVKLNGLTFPVQEIDSEAMWNKINIIPTATINMPTYYFVKGYNEIGLWPTPSTAATAGLMVSYEPRLVDMSIDDVTSTSNSYTKANPATQVTASVTNGSTSVTLSQAIAAPNMVGQWFQVTDGSDGNWYQITARPDTTHLTLGQDYAGLSGATTTFIVGQAPDVPEDYHLAFVYFAAAQFFHKRKDEGQAGTYMAMFNDLLNQYIDTYAAKTTGQVQNDLMDMGYNIFQLPPNPIT